MKNDMLSTKLGAVEKQYGIKFDASPNMKLGAYLKLKGFNSLGIALEKIERKAKKEDGNVSK